METAPGVKDGTRRTSVKSTSAMVGRATPLMRQHWYVAAWGEEVGRVPLRRQILEQDIVFYRRQDGTPVALQNRCAHRSYPLSKGRLDGDRIICGYHGIEYNPDGSCGLVPSLKSAPGTLHVQAYPIVEQGPFLWIWMGGSDTVDHSALVRQPWFTESGWTHVKGYIHMRANYLGLHENLLDLSHFPFVHGAVVGKPEHAEARPRVFVEGDVVHSSVLHRDVMIPPAYHAASDLLAPFDRLSEQFVPSPAIHVGKAILTDSNEPPRRHIRYVIHCPTPETQTSTHYFWAVARDHLLDNTDVDDEAQMIASKAFNEDREVLEAIEELLEVDDRPGFRETIIRMDEGAIQMLRAFWRMAERENR